MNEPAQQQMGFTNHPCAASCHPPAAAHPQLAGTNMDLIHTPHPPAELEGFVDALGAGFRAGTNLLFVCVNVDTPKKETERNAADADSTAVSESQTGSMVAALPMAGCGRQGEG